MIDDIFTDFKKSKTEKELEALRRKMLQNFDIDSHFDCHCWRVEGIYDDDFINKNDELFKWIRLHNKIIKLHKYVPDSWEVNLKTVRNYLDPVYVDENGEVQREVVSND